MPSLLRIALVLAAVVPWTATAATADEEGAPQQTDEQPPIQKRGAGQSASTVQHEQTLGEVEVVAPPTPPPAASSEEVRPRDYELRPHATTQEILNDLPGVVVAQHQGGGKAPQYLVRGFDADHGTDFAVFVDDLPVNLPTHAHGQGYADLNFLIPETVDRFQLYKGPYFLHFGDFANAGALNAVTLDELKENFVRAEGGSFDAQRYVAGVSPKLGGVKTVVAAQAYFSDGPFEHPQHYNRYNLFTKFTLDPTPLSKLSISGSLYEGTWRGSGQIPLREVSAGRLDRFGAIDPTEGGRTDREDLNLHYNYVPTAADTLSFQVYASRYKLALFSDFTFFKDTGLRFIRQADGTILDTRETPVEAGATYVPGDGIEQNDQRFVYGARGRYAHTWTLSGLPLQSEVGLETRNDQIHLALHRQVQRERFFTVNELAVDERSVSGFLGQQVFFTEWIRLEVGVRGDVFFFSGFDRLPNERPDPNFDPVRISGRTTDGILSPKANLTITPVTNTDVYLNFGEGFHSNDARNALLAKRNSFSPLTRSIGYEVGARTRQWDRLDAAAALWLLDLDSELVFSGDVGRQETGAGGSFQPAGATRRVGVDFETRYQFARWLYADYDLAWADPHFTNGDAIPLAPTLLMNGGLTAELLSGFSTALRVRFLDDRPAKEDRSLTARGYTLLDFLAKYHWRNVEASLALLNLTNTDWREAQFADNTCVRRELRATGPCAFKPGKQGTHPDPPADIHFTSGNPVGVRAGFTLFF